MKTSKTLFFYDRPLFGLDIGTNSIKVVQIESRGAKQFVVGYGVVDYDSSAISNGVITKPELLAKATKELFEHRIIGGIYTRRAALSLPISQTYSRVMSLPAMSKKDLPEAVRLEAEQYIPVPIADLYIDFSVTANTKEGYELLVAAAPKQIVDSYLAYADLIGIEVCTIETTISASSRLIAQSEQNDVPTILIDFGSGSVDITIFDKQLIVTGTVSGGGDNFTSLIAEKLSVSGQVAHTIKTKYGLGVSKRQQDIQEALGPILTQLVKEIRKMVRYYAQHTATDGQIGQIITMGGGANIPGLSEYLTDALRLPTRLCNPWANLDFGRLQPPIDAEKSSYVTASGLALINPKEILA